MIGSNEIQLAYNEMYKNIRNYIWDFVTVNALADFEMACYKACPNLDDIRRYFGALKSMMMEVYKEDDEFSDSFDKFEKLVNSADEVYTVLYQVNEVIQNENK